MTDTTSKPTKLFAHARRNEDATTSLFSPMRAELRVQMLPEIMQTPDGLFNQEEGW